MKNQSCIGSGAKKYGYIPVLTALFVILISISIPQGAIFGSHTDWLSQHVTLAETIRSACLEQHTLLPSWIDLGGGSNGYMFSYYGFLRPDILIGCLLPQVSMLHVLIGYMLAIYLASVLLCYIWLTGENIRPVFAFTGSVIFMTAGCFFHMHRQIMFVNYLPFLLAAFLCIRRKRIRILPIFLTLICLSSFYFAIPSFAAVGWYWYQQEAPLIKNGAHWKRSLLKSIFSRGSFLPRYMVVVITAVGISAALLLPTALVLMEHRRNSGGMSLMSLLELFAPNPVMNNILFNEYGMGLSFVCLYAILAGLIRKGFRRDSFLFLLLGIFGVFSWILNGTLYARPKILIPFMPLVVLHCVRYWQEMLPPIREYTVHMPFKRLPLFPFVIIFPAGLLWFSQPQFPWIMAEAVLLLGFCVICNRKTGHSHRSSSEQDAGTPLPRLGHRLMPRRNSRFRFWLLPRLDSLFFCRLLPLVLLMAPVGLYLTTASTEEWVYSKEIDAGFTKDELKDIDMDPLYHFDSMTEPLISANELPKSGMTRSTMYSSITNQSYSSLYYDTLLTPIRINNRVALLTSDNPFLFRQLGVRYLETDTDHIPAGYHVIAQRGDSVIAENENVLPRAYFTRDLPDESVITSEKLREYTPGLSAGHIPDGLTVKKNGDTYEITAEKSCTLHITITNPSPGDIVLLNFEVERLTHDAVIIDINGIRNKLSASLAAYPNGNDCFHYQFSTDLEHGVTQLSITFSKGHYILRNPQWQLFGKELLDNEEYTPLTLDTDSTFNVMSGTVTTDSSGYLSTSIPLQKGLEILVDGRPAELIPVNKAFAGVALSEGTHHIGIRFSPPGKTVGCTISLLSMSGYGIWILMKKISKRGKSK